jgi:hypothetical protein
MVSGKGGSWSVMKKPALRPVNAVRGWEVGEDAMRNIAAHCNEVWRARQDEES